MDAWLVLAISVFGMLLLMALGLPIAFAIAAMGIVGTIYTWGWSGLFTVASTSFGEATTFIYVAVPLFLLMAHFLQHSGIADDMYEIIYRWAGGIRGGLAMGTVVICAIFGAMSGISSAATVTMGLIAFPSMMKRGYDKSMALGCIVAGGTLGVLIPPSIMMIVYAGVSEVSVGKLFVGGIIPGIIVTLLFIAYIGIRCWIRPEMGPAVDIHYNWKEKLVSLKGVALPVILIMLVLGTIYTGVCTPTEAAGIGALGALMCMAIYRRATYEKIKSALMFTLRTNAMVMWIMLVFLIFLRLQDSTIRFMRPFWGWEFHAGGS
jgi:tripartite ATP-independent transporter DctM subunit